MSNRARRKNTSKLASHLRSFVDIAGPRGGWLGIREGSALRLVSAWRAPGLRGKTYDIHGNPLLRRLKRTRAPVVCLRDSAGWVTIPDVPGRTDAYWSCFPLVEGRDLVGAVALWGPRPLKSAVARELRALAKRLGPAIGAEAKLEQLALELEQGASAIKDSGEAPVAFRALSTLVQHVQRRLRRAIPGVDISVAVPDWRSGVYHEFRLVGGRFASTRSPIVERLGSPLSQASLAKPAGRNKTATAPGSWMAIPLALRGRQEGALRLRLPGAATGAEHLDFIRKRIVPPFGQLVVHARDRERRLLQEQRLRLIASLSTEVAGLADTRQIVEAAAGRIAQLFDGGLARIVLSDGGTTALMAATAGSVGAKNKAAMAMDVAEVDKALSGKVLTTGQSLLVRGAEASRLLGLKSGSLAGSAVCVPIKDQDRTLGTIEVRCKGLRAINDDDVDAIECLSAVVASAVAFARNQASAGEAASSASRRPQRIPEDRLIRAAKLISVGEMAAGIAHELNNPLTTVTGFAELVLDEIPEDAAYRADVEMVLKEARRARSVIRRLLDFARQGEGTRSRSDIGEIVDDVLGLTTHLMQTNGVRLEFVRAENLPWVVVNTNQLKQVFLNLVHNALQAMPAGGKLTVVIELQRESGRDWVVVRIKDDGLGIRPGDMSRIFEPFFTTRAEHGGTGLGLSVSYGIISEHGGRIDVESQLGHGSTFSVWLPV
ncbi:MAG: ATP-binding protein [Anaerolineales bacterium]